VRRWLSTYGWEHVCVFFLLLSPPPVSDPQLCTNVCGRWCAWLHARTPGGASRGLPARPPSVSAELVVRAGRGSNCRACSRTGSMRSCHSYAHPPVRRRSNYTVPWNERVCLPRVAPSRPPRPRPAAAARFVGPPRPPLSAAGWRRTQCTWQRIASTSTARLPPMTTTTSAVQKDRTAPQTRAPAVCAPRPAAPPARRTTT
jgi:hypothetical protein